MFFDFFITYFKIHENIVSSAPCWFKMAVIDDIMWSSGWKVLVWSDGWDTWLLIGLSVCFVLMIGFDW